MTTRTRDDLLIWQFSVRLAGVLEPQTVFQVGFTSTHAAELLNAALVKEHGEHRFSINPDALRVEQSELPDSLGLFGKLQRQRDELFPPPPRVQSGPLFLFWLAKSDGRGKRRHTVFQADENRDAARRSAESHATANGLKVLGGFEQFELAEYLRTKHMQGKADSELFSKLTPEHARELAALIRDAYAARWAEFAERIKREAVELHHFPEPAKLAHKAPRPSTLEQTAFAVLEQTRPIVETPADKRERLERRREAIHAGAE